MEFVGERSAHVLFNNYNGSERVCMRIYVGCDLGGTNIKVGVVDVETGNIIEMQSAPTLAREGHEVFICNQN